MKGGSTRVVTLGRPRYRARGRVLRFPVRGVTKLGARRVRLDSPSLYVDEATSPPPPLPRKQPGLSPQPYANRVIVPNGGLPGLIAWTTVLPDEDSLTVTLYPDYSWGQQWQVELSPSTPTVTLTTPRWLAGRQIATGSSITYTPGTATSPSTVSVDLTLGVFLVGEFPSSAVVAAWNADGTPAPLPGS